MRSIITTSRHLALALLVLAAAGCAPREGPQLPRLPTLQGDANPAAAGFDLGGSDREAIDVADAVMRRMGGRQAWDRTRYIAWTFFGRRHHLWDKTQHRARVEWTERDGGASMVAIVDLDARTGTVWRDGVVVDDPGAAQQAYEAWVNDSYWLVMPYKLKDAGVTLRHLGMQQMADGRPSVALELTFDDVGVTPGNKYVVHVAPGSGFVEQWDFYTTRDDAEPRFRTPWRDWTRYGQIWLSSSRGEGRRLDGIQVLETVPPSAWTSPSPWR